MPILKAATPRENANDEPAEDAPEPQRELLASGAATDAKKTTVDGVCYTHPNSEDEARDQRRNPTASLLSGYVAPRRRLRRRIEYRREKGSSQHYGPWRGMVAKPRRYQPQFDARRRSVRAAA